MLLWPVPLPADTPPVWVNPPEVGPELVLLELELFVFGIPFSFSFSSSKPPVLLVPELTRGRWLFRAQTTRK